MLNAIGFILFVLGGTIMVVATVNYHRLLNYFEQQVYVSLGKQYRVNLALLYLFVFGFILAAVDALLRKGSLFHCFAALGFALAAGYILFSVRAQVYAAEMLRTKVLEAIRAFVNTIDEKDNSFRGHSKHVFDIVDLFYDELEDYHQVLNREKLLDAAILHDIGKINISADILSKREQLTNEEWETLKSHPRRGKEMLDETGFREIGGWVMYHHEWVNGNGYYSQASENIPLESKILAIADAYSALCSDRAYRKRMTHEEAVKVINAGAGKQFDRKLVDCFLRIDSRDLEAVTILAHADDSRPRTDGGMP